MKMKFFQGYIVLIIISIFMHFSLHGQEICVDTIVIRNSASKPKFLSAITREFLKRQKDTFTEVNIHCSERATYEIIELIDFNSRSNLLKMATAIFSAVVITNDTDKINRYLSLGIIEVHLNTEEMAKGIYTRYYRKKEKYLVAKNDLKIRLVHKGTKILILYSPLVFSEDITLFIDTF